MCPDVSQRQYVVINASNLHGGGGLQVAISFLQEIAAMPAAQLRLAVIASSEVSTGLLRLGVDCSVFDRFEVLDTYAWRGMSALRKSLRGADAVFTVFGPLYMIPKPAAFSIVGFAQPWIIYPQNPLYSRLSVMRRLTTQLHYFLKKLAFQFGSDAIFAEAEHVRRELVARRLFKSDRITVISNCISDLYTQPQIWADADMPKGRSDFTLGIVSRDYAHKNLDVIPEVKAILYKDHGLNVDFVVTLDGAEWAAKSDGFRTAVLNAGPLHVEQCPSFYSKLDGIFFPSLLECFSATPLEAMVMRKPLFASDRGFVRDFCRDFPWYFDPESPTDAARAIAGFLRSGGDAERIEAAYKHVLSLPGARQRAVSYLSQIGRHLADRLIKSNTAPEKTQTTVFKK